MVYSGIEKIRSFQRRARRKEYWMYVLFNFIFALVLTIIDRAAGLTLGRDVGILAFIYGLATIIPSLAVLSRRLHDTNRTAWWIFIGLIPLVGGIILIVFAALDSQPGENRFGPNPKDNISQPPGISPI